ncbi:MAG: carboxynorspermidine decarboxylase [Saprospiraceae bacterium]|jgi:carboxynorspermidine decarboxylase|nr:carboxynorspermidine decarboxylase [Saprospiraceae bacterium]
MGIPYQLLETPAFVLDESLLRRNLELINRVQNEAGVKFILAFKGFSMWSAFPIVKEYVNGATASSLNEALLCFEEMGVKAHTYAAAFIPSEFDQIMDISSHITFNSIRQYETYKQKIENHPNHISCGIRVNPEWSDVKTELYNPASPSSRLGELYENFQGKLPDGIEGLHFHVLCESNSFALETVLENLEKRFGKFLKQIKWLNMGGGHLLTRSTYNVDHLIQVLLKFKQKHNLEIILEPGSAFAWETGDLVTRVLDIVDHRGVKTILIDASFTAHMPDTLEMPYNPTIVGARVAKEGETGVRIGGTSCLAGDFIGDYVFENEPEIGDLMIFKDMIHYTMVKTTTFNGVKHPDICIYRKDGIVELVKKFGYLDFKNRLS